MKWREEGEAALLVTWPELAGEETASRILTLREKIAGSRRPWLTEAVPGAASLLLVFDPTCAGPEEALRLLEELGDGPAVSSESRSHHLLVKYCPVKYGGPEGPDLERVARTSGLTPEEVVRRHSSGRYRVAFMGFAPGFPYLSGLPPELSTPRLDRPRPRVPAGSVAIGGAQAGIYPSVSPGGWNLIGRTGVKLLDWSREEPFLLSPGDRLVFVPTEIRSFPEEAAAASPPAAVEDPVLELAETGLLTTVQDLGRAGHAHQGIPPAGPMDPAAFRLANLAAGNPQGDPALELTFPGPRLRFLEKGSFALGGGDLRAVLSGKAIPLYERLDARAGEELSFQGRRSGQWGYLALAGGLARRRHLGSASTDTRSGLGRLVAGERIAAARRPPPDGRRIPRELAALPGPSPSVRFIPPEGPEPIALEGATVVLSPQRDRAGYRTLAPQLPGGEGSMVSEPIAPGTIQLPPDGLPIFLLAERPVTGGYRKLAFFAGVDLRVITQSPPGTPLQMVKVTAAEARRLLVEERQSIDALE
jgi:KipI family sensor histidine kinase inhibitor